MRCILPALRAITIKRSFVLEFKHTNQTIIIPLHNVSRRTQQKQASRSTCGELVENLVDTFARKKSDLNVIFLLIELGGFGITPLEVRGSQFRERTSRRTRFEVESEGHRGG